LVTLKLKRSDHDPIFRIMIEEMEGVAGNQSPPPTALSGGWVKKPAPFSCLLMEYAPLCRKVKGR